MRINQQYVFSGLLPKLSMNKIRGFGVDLSVFCELSRMFSCLENRTVH